MATLRLENGERLDTREIPANWEPCFCCVCGGRIGWYDTSYGDAAIVAHDGCVLTVEA